MHSQIRFGDVEDRLPGVEALVDESIEMLQYPQLAKDLGQS